MRFPGLHSLGHLQVLGGAAQPGDGVGGDLEVDAVAELDDEVKRLGVAGHARDLEVGHPGPIGP